MADDNAVLEKIQKMKEYRRNYYMKRKETGTGYVKKTPVFTEAELIEKQRQREEHHRAHMREYYHRKKRATVVE